MEWVWWGGLAWGLKWGSLGGGEFNAVMMMRWVAGEKKGRDPHPPPLPLLLCAPCRAVPSSYRRTGGRRPWCNTQGFIQSMAVWGRLHYTKKKRQSSLVQFSLWKPPKFNCWFHFNLSKSVKGVNSF
jgi:hypothetical protein